MNDKTTTVADVKAAITEFVDERDWSQYHDPKSLVLAIASEVGELADHFRWLTREESFEVIKDPADAKAIANELADVIMFALEFASVCKIDISTAVEDKLRINAEKYPVDKAKGSKLKYDRL